MFESSAYQNRNHGTAEQRLWRAVIAKTLEEWMNGPLRDSRIAEEFLFYDNKDFVSVCSSAGMDPLSLREKFRFLCDSLRNFVSSVLRFSEFNTEGAEKSHRVR